MPPTKKIHQKNLVSTFLTVKENCEGKLCFPNIQSTSALNIWKNMVLFWNNSYSCLVTHIGEFCFYVLYCTDELVLNIEDSVINTVGLYPQFESNGLFGSVHTHRVLLESTFVDAKIQTLSLESNAKVAGMQAYSPNALNNALLDQRKKKDIDDYTKLPWMFTMLMGPNNLSCTRKGKIKFAKSCKDGLDKLLSHQQNRLHKMRKCSNYRVRFEFFVKTDLLDENQIQLPWINPFELVRTIRHDEFKEMLMTEIKTVLDPLDNLARWIYSHGDNPVLDYSRMPADVRTTIIYCLERNVESFGLFKFKGRIKSQLLEWMKRESPNKSIFSLSRTMVRKQGPQFSEFCIKNLTFPSGVEEGEEEEEEVVDGDDGEEEEEYNIFANVIPGLEELGEETTDYWESLVMEDTIPPAEREEGGGQVNLGESNDVFYCIPSEFYKYNEYQGDSIFKDLTFKDLRRVPTDLQPRAVKVQSKSKYPNLSLEMIGRVRQLVFGVLKQKHRGKNFTIGKLNNIFSDDRDVSYKEWYDSFKGDHTALKGNVKYMLTGMCRFCWQTYHAMFALMWCKRKVQLNNDDSPYSNHRVMKVKDVPNNKSKFAPFQSKFDNIVQGELSDKFKAGQAECVDPEQLLKLCYFTNPDQYSSWERLPTRQVVNYILEELGSLQNWFLEEVGESVGKLFSPVAFFDLLGKKANLCYNNNSKESLMLIWKCAYGKQTFIYSRITPILVHIGGRLTQGGGGRIGAVVFPFQRAGGHSTPNTPVGVAGAAVGRIQELQEEGNFHNLTFQYTSQSYPGWVTTKDQFFKAICHWMERDVHLNYVMFKRIKLGFVRSQAGLKLNPANVSKKLTFRDRNLNFLYLWDTAGKMKEQMRNIVDPGKTSRKKKGNAGEERASQIDNNLFVFNQGSPNNPKMRLFDFQEEMEGQIKQWISNGQARQVINAAMDGYITEDVLRVLIHWKRKYNCYRMQMQKDQRQVGRDNQRKEKESEKKKLAAIGTLFTL